MVEFLKDQNLLSKRDDRDELRNCKGKKRKNIEFSKTCTVVFILTVFSQTVTSFPMMMQPSAFQMGVPQAGIPQMGIPQMGIPQMAIPQMVSDIQHFPPPVPQIALPNTIDPMGGLMIPQNPPVINPINPGLSLGNVGAPNILNSIGLDPSFAPSSQSPAFLSGYRAALDDLAHKISVAYVVKQTTDKLKDVKPMNPFMNMLSQMQSPYPAMPGFPAPFGYPSPFGQFGMGNAFNNPNSLNGDGSRKKKKSKKSKRRSSKSRKRGGSRRKSSRSGRSRRSRGSSRRGF